jgi:hypothetical protein
LVNKGDGSCQEIPFFAYDPELPTQTGHLLAFVRRQPITLTRVDVGLRQPAMHAALGQAHVTTDLGNRFAGLANQRHRLAFELFGEPAPRALVHSDELHRGKYPRFQVPVGTGQPHVGGCSRASVHHRLQTCPCCGTIRLATCRALRALASFHAGPLRPVTTVAQEAQSVGAAGG